MRIDRSKFLSMCAAIAIPTLAIACGAGSEDTMGGGSDLNVNDASASTSADAVKVTTKALKSNANGCTVDISGPVVSIPGNKAAETAINGVLASITKSPCDEGAGDFESTYAVAANGNGFLSITVTGSFYEEGAAHPNGYESSYNFDVKNGGKQLQLADVATATGIAKQQAACMKQSPTTELDDAGAVVDDSLSTEWCKDAVTPDPQYKIVPTWAARPEGLVLIAGTDHASGDSFEATVAWKDLASSDLVAGTVLADYAKAHR